MIGAKLERFAKDLGAANHQETQAVVKGVIAAASSLIPTVQFRDREGRPTRLNMYYAVIAAAGSNKSRVVNWND